MAELTDVLAFWHPYRDEELSEDYLPWGVVAPGSSADKTVRVRNLSPHYTAAGVVVSVTEMGLAEPTRAVAPQHLLSMDGQRFAATAQVGTIAPGAISGPVTVRRVTAVDADPGDGDFQLLAHPTEWS